MADQRLDGTTSPNPRGVGAGDYDVRSPDGSSFDARDSNRAGEDVVMPDPPITDPTDWKVNPDNVPLHPTGKPPRHTKVADEEDLNTAGVIRNVPAYPVSRTGSRVGAGSIGGLLGAVFLVAISYVIFWADPANPGALPAFVGPARIWLGNHGVGDHLLGICGFLAAGAAWGALFGLIVRKPNLVKGAAFGFLPTLFLWLVMAPLLHKPLFMGGGLRAIGMPILYNVLIWGTFVGSFSERHLRPPSTAAV